MYCICGGGCGRQAAGQLAGSARRERRKEEPTLWYRMRKERGRKANAPSMKQAMRLLSLVLSCSRERASELWPKYGSRLEQIESLSE